MAADDGKVNKSEIKKRFKVLKLVSYLLVASSLKSSK